MPKRVSDVYLTQTNFDEEVPNEDPGKWTPNTADTSVTKRRILKAHRRHTHLIPENINASMQPSDDAVKPAVKCSGLFDNPLQGMFAKPAKQAISSEADGKIAKQSSLESNPDKPKPILNKSENEEYEKLQSVFKSKLLKLNEAFQKHLNNSLIKSKFVVVSSMFAKYDNYLQSLRNDAYLDNHYCYTSARVNTLAAYRDNPKLLTAYEADVVAYVDSASTPSDATDSKLTSKSTEIDFSDANRKPLVFGAPFSGGNETSTFSFASADKPAIAKFDFGKPSAETPNSLFPNFSGLSKPLLPVTNATANASASQSPTGGAGNVSAAAPSFSFGSSAKLPSVSSGNTFPVFGKKDTNDKPTFGVPMSSKSTGQFGDNGFSFGVPVTNVSTFSASTDEEYKPPVDVCKEIVEDDAFFTMKCKLFYKKEDKFIDRGVGNLYLKKSGKGVTLLLRAATNLGTILLNIKVHKDLPIMRSGKNNVALMCIPNPPFEKDNTDLQNLLLRVKTSELADTLQEKLLECKSM